MSSSDANLDARIEYVSPDADLDLIVRHTAAFANTRGGKIYIGVDAFGEIVGIADPDEFKSRIVQALRDEIAPDVTNCVRFTVEQADSQTLLAMEIERGPYGPYWLLKRGLSPAGVYLRSHGALKPAAKHEIERALKRGSPKSYELRRSLRQELTFVQTAKSFNDRQIRLDRADLEQLGLVDAAGLYTNLAYLFSDQCGPIVKTIVYDESEERAVEKRELAGPVYRQAEETLAAIAQYADAHGARIEFACARPQRGYAPRLAVSEALWNAVAHRDYDALAPTLVRVYPDRVEIVSPGGAPQGIAANELDAGYSAARNPKLFNALERMGYADAQGVGLRRVRRAYDGLGEKPQFDFGRGRVAVVLPCVVRKTELHAKRGGEKNFNVETQNGVGRSDGTGKVELAVKSSKIGFSVKGLR